MRSWSEKLGIKKTQYSSITPESVFMDRRKFVASAVALGILPDPLRADVYPIENFTAWNQALPGALNTYEDITNYNNYYEFGTDKLDPAKNAHTLKPDPWSITVEGQANLTGTFQIESLQQPPLEERVYKLRCVEAWSMVVPWVGFSLSKWLEQFEPNSKAKYVQFYTLHDPEQMPGQLSRVLDWPYREGLTIDEAMHPLSFIAVGLYGRTLPNQNGAPLRLLTPWKYGFKSIKSIVKVVFTESMPETSWTKANAREYGFYANVNPNVSHPRWSQASERVLGEGFFSPRIPTEMFNGYGDQVASLYNGIDLSINY
jgi:methionine sulfoxide reductase catalytic subunit